MCMDTSALKKFAQNARRHLLSEVEAQLGRVLKLDSAEIRESAGVIDSLKKQIHLTSREAVIDRVAYTWFNRLCALRFMDVNHYTELGIVSPVGDFTLPEILQEAKLGNVDPAFHPYLKMDRLFGLLDGSVPSSDPQQEAYRLLLVAACNRYHPVMPFMFERIDDYTELLMPRDLLSESAVLSPLREVLTEETCRDVEVIGWLYQFYISEKKDEVFEELKKNRKITPENIPAATQLFTPHWIVRYLVENSLGRLWMLNHPDSRLIEKMDYYIKPEEPETDFLQIISPEQIRICDPACGSGHMLTYAFDLLYAIYEEEGYPPGEIPEKILTNNLYGIEIDERAGELAAFALAMKARERDRRFLTRRVKPYVCVLDNVQFAASELQIQEALLGSGPIKADLYHDLTLFHEGRSFGSLLKPALPADRLCEFRKRFTEKPGTMMNLGLIDEDIRLRALKALIQSEFLSSRYQVVVTNPPYMSDKYFSQFLKDKVHFDYPDSRHNLYSMFLERVLGLIEPCGYVGMITLHSWMSGSKYQLLRERLLTSCSIISMAHLGSGAFESIGGQVVSTTAFIICKRTMVNSCGVYLDLTMACDEQAKGSLARETVNYAEAANRYLVSGAIFDKIPGSPIVYWISPSQLNSFITLNSFDSYADFRQGMATTDNEKFLRRWSELSLGDFVLGARSAIEATVQGRYWFPYNKGGGDRRWYGHNDFMVRYENNGRILIELVRQKYPRISDPEFVIKNRSYYFKPSVTYSALSDGNFAARLCDQGFIFDTKGSCAFPKENTSRESIAALLNSCVASTFLRLLAPTLDFSLYSLNGIPVPSFLPKDVEGIAKKCLLIAKSDWDSYETSWDFTSLPLLSPNYRQQTLKATYQTLRAHWREMTLEMERLEEENNRIFIEAYRLQDELTPDVPFNEITLTCNPHYRYGNSKSEEELEALLLADTMRELISYAVGCMFGRYSLDKRGLVLANQGETIKDYLRQVPNPTFLPDEDNVIPILEGEWFSDDITERFKKFLKITFGEAHYPENLAFIENAIGKDIRKFFLKDFYEDHVKRYKKRPIYWLFSSPNGGFNALIYMHRYRPDTVSVVLNGYLRDFRTKLKSRTEHLQLVEANPQTANKDKTAALKEMEKIRKLIKELDEYESNVLFPLAAQKIEIDLDDGVKVNYAKFDKALRPIKGLENED